MNHAGYSAGNVILQGRYEGVPGQPGGPTMVQYTTVNISSEPPKDHIVWSLCSLVYANPFCLGLAALIHSVKARDRRWAGDLEGARRYGSRACCLNTLATVLTSIMVLIVVIVIIVMSVHAHNAYSYNHNRYY